MASIQRTDTGSLSEFVVVGRTRKLGKADSGIQEKWSNFSNAKLFKLIFALLSWEPNSLKLTSGKLTKNMRLMMVSKKLPKHAADNYEKFYNARKLKFKACLVAKGIENFVGNLVTTHLSKNKGKFLSFCVK